MTRSLEDSERQCIEGAYAAPANSCRETPDVAVCAERCLPHVTARAALANGCCHHGCAKVCGNKPGVDWLQKEARNPGTIRHNV